MLHMIAETGSVVRENGQWIARTKVLEERQWIARQNKRVARSVYTCET
jgi:hypothetical protein